MRKQRIKITNHARMRYLQRNCPSLTKQQVTKGMTSHRATIAYNIQNILKKGRVVKREYDQNRNKWMCEIVSGDWDIVFCEDDCKVITMWKTDDFDSVWHAYGEKPKKPRRARK